MHIRDTSYAHTRYSIYWPRSWPRYSYKTLATYKSMVVLISGVFRNNFFFGKGEVGRTLSKLNHIIQQSYYISEQYLIQEEVLAQHLGRLIVLEVRILSILVSKQAYIPFISGQRFEKKILSLFLSQHT